MPKKLTQEEFIERCKNKWGDRYNYDKVVYTGSKNKVIIICPKHGEFKIAGNNFLSGQGCHKCGTDDVKSKLSKGKEAFIKEANEKFNNKYDYSLVDYKNNKTKVKIICPIHGVFEQGPTVHLNSFGCPKCTTKNVHKEQSYTKKVFISKAKAIHGNKYNYDKVEYVNNYTKVCITCPKHGDFWQRPMNHLTRKQGCPECKNSQGENEISDLLNLNNIYFQSQKRFIGCRNKRVLSFDFYLPEYNLAIEYDGEQHYKPVKGYGGEPRFKSQQKKDNIKTNYCYENDIVLCRIKYNQDIYTELSKYIQLKELNE